VFNYFRNRTDWFNTFLEKEKSIRKLIKFKKMNSRIFVILKR